VRVIVPFDEFELGVCAVEMESDKRSSFKVSFFTMHVPYKFFWSKFTCKIISDLLFTYLSGNEKYKKYENL
jgi:hypothetical protein